jgi:rifampicin phosphotransferase
MPHVLDLASVAELTEVGGKSRNLGILLRAGFPVPPGFCVTTDGYREVVADRLGQVLDELTDADADDQPALHRLAARARALIEDAPIPEALAQEITHAYSGLGADTPVAVRSSATAEDLETASFAGQQDTYLNVVGPSAVLAAVRNCWASLWTDRAVSYRASHRVDQTTVALSVVVQQMVDAAAAGVMFTADPVSGTRRRAVIDASPGLGEAVVSGAVNPDRLVVDSATGTVVERHLGDKRVAVRARVGGGTEFVPLADGSDSACLTDAQASALAELGAEVERHYGAPQDTEWALDTSGTLWLTQARPITTLYPLLTRPDRDGTRVFLCATLAQGLTRPITPMGLAVFRLIGSSVFTVVMDAPPPDQLAGPTAIQIAGSRAFFDLTVALRRSVPRRLMFAAFGIMEARAAAVVRALADDPRFELQANGRAAFLRGLVRVMVHTRAPLHALQGLANPDRAVRQIERRADKLRRALAPPATASPEERLDLVQHALAGDVFMAMPGTIGYAVPGFALLGLARRLLRGRATSDDLQTVLRGLPNNVTTEMDLALWDLTQLVRADPSSAEAFEADIAPLTRAYLDGLLPRVAQEGLDDFLRRYGHRAVAEIDLGMPRWNDDPTHLIGVIKNYLGLTDPTLAPAAQFAAGAASAEAMMAGLIQRAGGPRSARGRLVAFCLDRGRRLAGLRESPKFLLILQFALLRQQLQRVGESLTRRGLLDAPDDVFFVDLAEARAGLSGTDLRPVVASNRESYRTELTRRHVPRILLTDGTEPETTLHPAGVGETDLVGSPASAGVVTARARVVLDPVGAHLQPGEILVAPSTDPGWTPLFLTAGGLVMEMGGANSHGAVVAREYGIPAVVGVADATQKITTGDLITVDGAAGLIRPADEAAPTAADPFTGATAN